MGVCEHFEEGGSMWRLDGVLKPLLVRADACIQRSPPDANLGIATQDDPGEVSTLHLFKGDQAVLRFDGCTDHTLIKWMPIKDP